MKDHISQEELVVYDISLVAMGTLDFSMTALA